MQNHLSAILSVASFVTSGPSWLLLRVFRSYIAHCPKAWQPITIHHLLTHTSGFPALNPPLQKVPTSPEELLAHYKDVPLNFIPGAKYK